MKLTEQALEKAYRTLPYNDALYGDSGKPITKDELRFAIATALVELSKFFEVCNEETSVLYDNAGNKVGEVIEDADSMYELFEFDVSIIERHDLESQDFPDKLKDLSPSEEDLDEFDWEEKQGELFDEM